MQEVKPPVFLDLIGQDRSESEFGQLSNQFNPQTVRNLIYSTSPTTAAVAQNEIDLARSQLQAVWDEAPNRWLSARQVAKLATLRRREVEKPLELLRQADLVDRLDGGWLFPSH